jgi:hypothetical protein
MAEPPAAARRFEAILLPLGAYSATGDVVDLTFDHTLSPSAHNTQSTDHRQLALRVDRIWVESEAGQNVNGAVRSLRSAASMPAGIATTR